MPRRPLALTLALVLFLAASGLAGDVIHLTNGDQLKGEIIAQTEQSVTIKTQYTTLTVPKHTIARIEKAIKAEEMINLYLKDGSIWRGIVLRQNEEHILIRRANGRQAIFLKADIERLDWKAGVLEKQNTGRDDRKAVNKAAAAATGKTGTTPPLPRFSGMTAGRIRLESLWRSALVPSWGQFWQGRKTMGYVWAGTTGATLFGMLAARISYRIEKSAWDAGDHSQERYDRMKRRSDLHFALSLTALCLWALNVADAAVFSPKTPVGLSLLPATDGPGVQVALNLRF